MQKLCYLCRSETLPGPAAPEAGELCSDSARACTVRADTNAAPERIKTTYMLEKIKKNPRLKHLLIGLISSHKNPRPRLWVRLLVNPFVHKRARGASVRSRGSRHDLFPWHRFEVGKGALIEQFTVLNNGAGDILIGAGARVGIGSVVIGPVRMGERAGLGQHVFVAGFNHGYADATRDSNTQPLVVREVVIGRESHIGANSVIVAGVHIGERVQIGAGSVVTKDIPSYCVAAGNPARIIKRYDFRRRRWVRVDEQPGANAGRSDGRNTEQRKKETRRDNDPAGHAAAPARPDNGRKSDRQQEQHLQDRAAGNTRTADERQKGAPDRKPKADASAADRARTSTDRQPRNRAEQAVRRTERESAQQTVPSQPTESPQASPIQGSPADAAAQPARRRRNRRKPEGPGQLGTGTPETVGTRSAGSADGSITAGAESPIAMGTPDGKPEGAPQAVTEPKRDQARNRGEKHAEPQDNPQHELFAGTPDTRPDRVPGKPEEPATGRTVSAEQVDPQPVAKQPETVGAAPSDAHEQPAQTR